jgi:glycosyltransferase involved in cell wall biosynthesis
MRTVVLTSTENFVWSSMQEIIPAIEQAWLASRGPRHEVRIVDVGQQKISEYLADVVRADRIVFTCFTVKLARLGEFLRRDANVDGRWVIYLHNQATIGCWPLFVWGMGNHLRTDDVFISSSKWDARTLKLTFPKADVRVHPFPLPLPLDEMKKSKMKVPTVYSGRLSSQKNVHTLIYAFSLYLERVSDAKLVVFGGEDGLGSPNMGFKDVGYENYLRQLVHDLKIEEKVEFTGNLPRAELHRRLRSPHVLVSASLHSDENFGMSALRSLCMGAPCVLSAWGGHADFAEVFGTQLQLVSVHGSEQGPWIDPDEFVKAMVKAARQRPRASRIPAKYRTGSMAGLLRKLAAEPRAKKRKPLETTPFAKALLEKREESAKTTPDGTKIFSSYADPNSHRLFTSYGMRKPQKAKRSKLAGARLRLVPWAKTKANSIEIADPHRGHWRLSWTGRAGMMNLLETKLVECGISHVDRG